MATKLRFCNNRNETQRGVLLDDGRIISIFGEDNKMCARFDDAIDIEHGINYGRQITKTDRENGLTTLNDVMMDGKGHEVTCYDEVRFYKDVYPSSKLDDNKIIKEAYQFFKGQGVVVTMDAIRHNYECWKGDYKSGYRDEINGYHLFSPCGCNPFSLSRTTLHELCADWQETYYA